MRKIIGILLFAALNSTVGMAQKPGKPVPQQVAMQFSNKFTHIRQVEWRVAENNRYEAQFQDGGIARKVVYANTGQWLVMESPASQQDFPQPVSRSLSQNFSGYQVSQATRMELFGKGIAFRIRIRKGNSSLDVDIDTYGNVRRRVKVVEVYEEHHHHDNCHHHHCGHHDHCDRHKHKDKHKHKHGKGHGRHHHDDDDDDDD
jgi:hypothetical protein